MVALVDNVVTSITIATIYNDFADTRHIVYITVKVHREWR